MIKPIEILKPNLLDEADFFDLQGGEISLKQGRKNIVEGGFSAVFKEPLQASKILIKNTDISNFALYVKNSAGQESFEPFEDFSFKRSGRDVLISFSSALEAVEFKFLFAGEDSSQSAFFHSFILTDALVLLDKALSSFTPSGYLRGGCHYTAAGSLVSWREFCKNSGSLLLENLPGEVKKTVESVCGEYVFLTFIFYGSYDLSQSGEYALTAPLKAELRRESGLWSLRLEITEK